MLPATPLVARRPVPWGVWTVLFTIVLYFAVHLATFGAYVILTGRRPAGLAPAPKAAGGRAQYSPCASKSACDCRGQTGHLGCRARYGKSGTEIEAGCLGRRGSWRRGDYRKINGDGPGHLGDRGIGHSGSHQRDSTDCASARSANDEPDAAPRSRVEFRPLVAPGGRRGRRLSGDSARDLHDSASR